MPPPPAASFPGPDALGRGVVVAAGAPPPPGFETAARVTVDDNVLADPAPLAAFLHHRWLQRERVVIELATDNDALRAPETCTDPPYEVGPHHTFHRERLHLLMWANTYDARSGEPIWWHGVLAERRAGARPLAAVTPHADTSDPTSDAVVGGLGDVLGPDGAPLWIDGGPRGPLASPLPAAHNAPIVHRESVALGKLTVQGAGDPVDGLAADQLTAVTHRSGPARIIAPAGSGKTRVLTARLRHLLRDRRVEPELVTAVAYNTRAAAEMRARTAELGANIRTLHSLALWICGLDERREVIHERDVRSILDELITVARIPNQDPFQPYLDALAETRLALRDPLDVEVSRGDVDGFSDVFDRYRKVLADRRVLDFDEQIYRAIELLLTRPDIRARAQRACTHLLVDEFQDLTPAFLLLVRLVAGPSMQVFGVGDDDQTIYSYAGATPRYLVDFDRWFPGAAHHALEVNYRCPPAVVERASTLLSHNRTRVRKTIRSGRMATSDPPADGMTVDGMKVDGATADGMTADGATVDGATVDVRAARSHDATTTALQVIQARIDDGTDPSDIAVLARVNAALLPLQVALTQSSIRHTAPLDASVLGRTGVRTALAYLRIGLDTERIRRDDLFDTINRPARKVRSAVTPLLKRSGARFSMRHLEQVVDSLEGAHQERFAGYLGDLRHLEHAITDGADTARCLWIIRNRIGLGEAMDALDASRTRPEGSSHGDDLDALEQLAELHPDPASFRDWLADRLRVPGDPQGITLSTVHRVKGMEWDHVLVVAANQGAFPHRLADDVEEERRVFHVAVTRCRERVHVISDQERTSPFVAELTRAADARPEPPEPGHGPLPERTDATIDADGRVVAAAGVELELPGGLTVVVVEVADEHVVAALTAPATSRSSDNGHELVELPFGTPVTADGRQGPLAAPPRRPGASGVATPGSGRGGGGGAGSTGGLSGLGGRGAAGQLLDADDEDVDPALYEALRVWRSRIAAEHRVPAYLVFHDRHLRLIAARRPGDLRELAACQGVGPTKLERYGDDVLSVVAAHAG